MGTRDKQALGERAIGAPKLLAVAIAAALSGGVPLLADAAGLGRLTVQSGLGQPLRAEVEITSLGREEAGSLTAKLAPADAFRQAGLEYNPALASLRFAVERRPTGSAVVRITSSQPLNEPFVDLLVELNWASGKFVREYTFLLDPPELRIGRDTIAGGAATSVSAPIVAPTVAAQAAPSQRASVPAASAPNTATAQAPAARIAPSVRPVNTPVAQPAPQAASAAGASAAATSRVVVRAGDTLAGIAGRVKPSDISLEQAVLAIYTSNPRAFFGTVHQMLAGASLDIPERAAMAAVDAASAKREIRTQAADFNAYRERLASAARQVEPARAGQSAAGSVGARVQDNATPAANGDQLKLSRSGAAAGTSTDAAGAAGSASGRSAAGAGPEAQVAREAALREQQERVTALERNIADLQQLVELKNRQLAELQRQVESVRATGTTASGAVGDAGAAAPAAARLPSDAAAAAVAAASSPTAATATSTAAPPAVPAVTGADASASGVQGAATPDAGSTLASASTASGTGPLESSSAGTSASDTVASAAPAAGPAPSPVAATPVSAAEPGALAALMDNPLLLPAFAAIALGLGAYGLYAVRRRKKPDDFEDSLSAADAFTANSLFGSTGGQAVDTHNSLFATNARDSGVDVHSTEVDPIAEAEVYIAYGREAQAEEILKEALKKQPERQAIRLKLLEIHAARKDPVAFGSLAQEMYDLTGGQNEEWPKVVTLGLSIDPANPLYTGQGDGAATAFAAGAPSEDGETPRAPAIEPGASAAASLSAAAGAAAAMFGDRLDAGGDAPGSSHRGYGPGSFAETVPMDGEGASSDDIPALDFDLDLESTVQRADAALAARSSADEPPAIVESDLERAIGGRFELPSLDLDMGSDPNYDAHGLASADADNENDEAHALADLGDFKIDLPSLEGLDTRPAFLDEGDQPAVDLADFDLGNDSGGDLDLSSGDLGLASADTALAPMVDSSRWQEMATKLDLASAYEEIGDKEGARELLQEVLEGGDVGQQQKARAMLSKIG